MNDNERKYYILSALTQSFKKILIENDFDLIYIQKLLKQIDKEVNFLQSNIPPENILVQEILKLTNIFKEKIDVSVHVVLKN